MRHVDHEAGIAARRPLPDLMRVDHDDLVVGAQLPQPARRRQAGEARADDQPVGMHVGIERPDGHRATADRHPTRRPGVDRKTPDGAVGHRTVSSTERSDTSIQMVLSSVYWS